MPDSRPHHSVVTLALLLCCLMLTSACARTVDVEFDSDRELMETAAGRLSQSTAATRSVEFVPLPADATRLAVDGEAWVIRADGHRYIFFPQSVEEPNFYVGYVYSPDGSAPSGVLVGADDSGMPMEKLAPNWWYGEIHQRWLAGERWCPSTLIASR